MSLAVKTTNDTGTNYSVDEITDIIEHVEGLLKAILKVRDVRVYVDIGTDT
jgi:uncharacterized protein YkvS